MRPDLATRQLIEAKSMMERRWSHTGQPVPASMRGSRKWCLTPGLDWQLALAVRVAGRRRSVRAHGDLVPPRQEQRRCLPARQSRPFNELEQGDRHHQG